jgi:hypothetical protein
VSYVSSCFTSSPLILVGKGVARFKPKALSSGESIDKALGVDGLQATLKRRVEKGIASFRQQKWA